MGSIVDVHLQAIRNPGRPRPELTAILAVSATGLFYDMADLAFVADEDTVSGLRVD